MESSYTWHQSHTISNRHVTVRTPRVKEERSRIFEKSSWGIVYRKSGKDIEVLLLSWKNGKDENVFVLPKGHMEWEETAKDTAIREISEETGLDPNDLEVIKFMTKINYSFVATHKEGNPVIDKDVYLFLVKYRGIQDPKPRKEERFTGFRWFSLEELKNMMIKPDVYGFIKKNLQYM